MGACRRGVVIASMSITVNPVPSQIKRLDENCSLLPAVLSIKTKTQVGMFSNRHCFLQIGLRLAETFQYPRTLLISVHFLLEGHLNEGMAILYLDVLVIGAK
jgi:hypothetical protein